MLFCNLYLFCWSGEKQVKEWMRAFGFNCTFKPNESKWRPNGDFWVFCFLDFHLTKNPIPCMSPQCFRTANEKLRLDFLRNHYENELETKQLNNQVSIWNMYLPRPSYLGYAIYIMFSKANAIFYWEITKWKLLYLCLRNNLKRVSTFKPYVGIVLY